MFEKMKHKTINISLTLIHEKETTTFFLENKTIEQKKRQRNELNTFFHEFDSRMRWWEKRHDVRLWKRNIHTFVNVFMFIQINIIRFEKIKRVVNHDFRNFQNFVFCWHYRWKREIFWYIHKIYFKIFDVYSIIDVIHRHIFCWTKNIIFLKRIRVQIECW